MNHSKDKTQELTGKLWFYSIHDDSDSLGSAAYSLCTVISEFCKLLCMNQFKIENMCATVKSTNLLQAQNFSQNPELRRQKHDAVLQMMTNITIKTWKSRHLNAYSHTCILLDDYKVDIHVYCCPVISSKVKSILPRNDIPKIKCRCSHLADIQRRFVSLRMWKRKNRNKKARKLKELLLNQ